MKISFSCFHSLGVKNIFLTPRNRPVFIHRPVFSLLWDIYLWIYILVISDSLSPCTMHKNSQP